MTFVLQPHTNFSMRPSNKDTEAFDLDELFNQYVETDFIQISDNTVDPSSSDDLAHLFDAPSSNGSDPFETTLMPDWDPSSDDAWHKALHSLDHNLASPSMPSGGRSIYPDSRGQASKSDPELFSFDDLFEFDQPEPRQSLSTPSTPKPQVQAARPSRKAPVTPSRPISQKVQKPTKKSSTFFKMMRPSHFRANIQDLWTRKIDGPSDAFNVQLAPNDIPSSPPVLTHPVTIERGNNHFLDQPYTIAVSPSTGEQTPDLHQSSYQLTPLSSPAIDTNSRRNTRVNSYQFLQNDVSPNMTHHFSNAALSALQTPPSSNGLTSTTWGPETPANMDFAFSSSPEYPSMQGWWNNGPTASAPQPSPPTYTVQSRSHSQNQMSFSSSSVAGLGISCDTASFPGFAQQDMSSTNESPRTTNDFGAPPHSFDMPYPQPAIYPVSPLQQGIHIGHRLTRTPSRSPSSSPMPQPRFTRRRHSAQINHNHNSHASGRINHRRKSSNSSLAQKSAAVGFVNFTPDDSRKILTGVAPSGSSKTKARREKEAAERRRKLSQAAVKAVMDAGGDLTRLEEGGLLTMEG